LVPNDVLQFTTNITLLHKTHKQYYKYIDVENNTEMFYCTQIMTLQS